jgi:hypothetical protein
MTDPSAVPRFRDYATPGGAQFDRARNLIATAFQQIDVNLNAASPAGGLILPIAGDFLYVDADPTFSNGVATLQLNVQQDAGVAKFYIQPGFALNTTFKQLRLDWSAQPGLFLRLLYATGDRVVPAFAAQSFATINNSINNSANVRDQGYIYGVSYKSTTSMAANTPDPIWSAAANINGAAIWDAELETSGAAQGVAVILAKATAPTGILDGDVFLQVVFQAAGNTASQKLNRAARVAAGKRLDYIVSTAEGAQNYRHVNYTLF